MMAACFVHRHTLKTNERRLTHHITGTQSESNSVRQGGLPGCGSWSYRRLTSVERSTADDPGSLLVRSRSRPGPHLCRGGVAVGRRPEAGGAGDGGADGAGGLVKSTQDRVVVEAVDGRRWRAADARVRRDAGRCDCHAVRRGDDEVDGHVDRKMMLSMTASPC